MMRQLLYAATAALLLPALSAAKDEAPKAADNPFRNAKVGDWAKYAVTTKVMGMDIEGSVKMVVTAKDDKSVTMKATPTFNGMELPGQEQKIDLTKPYDPAGAGGQLPKGTDAKTKKVGEGKEKIKVGGKEYATTWMKIKVEAKVMGNEFKSDVKVWMSKDVPLGGVVKMEMKSNIADMTMELKEFGKGKKE